MRRIFARKLPNDGSIGRSDTVGGAGAPVSGCAQKTDLYYLYALDVAVAGKEAAIVKRARSVNVQIRKEEAYRLPDPGIEPLRERPVIVGFGPAGMFCGLMLARAGYRPLILERGLDADSRAKAVARYWTDGTLDTECNVQFGEGGAGTFSDGS